MDEEELADIAARMEAAAVRLRILSRALAWMNRAAEAEVLAQISIATNVQRSVEGSVQANRILDETATAALPGLFALAKSAAQAEADAITALWGDGLPDV